MTSLGFENYGEALKIYLARYREVSRLSIHIPNSNIVLLSKLTSAKNLVARGEHQKPSASGSATGPNSTTSPSYEGGNHGGVLTNPMDPAVEAGTEFAYAHPEGSY